MRSVWHESESHQSLQENSKLKQKGANDQSRGNRTVFYAIADKNAAKDEDMVESTINSTCVPTLPPMTTNTLDEHVVVTSNIRQSKRYIECDTKNRKDTKQTTGNEHSMRQGDHLGIFRFVALRNEKKFL